MKKCLVWFRNSRYDMKAEEIIIEFAETNKWQEFIDKHSHQTVIVAIKSITELDYVLSQVADCRNIVFLLDHTMKELTTIVQKCIKNNIHYFYDIIVKDWETLNTLLCNNVYSIYISGDLGFDLPTVRKVADRINPNIDIRAILNSASTIYSFFIRPEDIDKYEEYIDTAEVYFPRDNPVIQDSLFNVYFEQKKWTKNISYLLQSSGEFDFPNKYIDDLFAAQRIKCGHKCKKGSDCNICGQIYELSHTIEENREEILNGKRSGTETEDNTDDS